MNFNAWMSFVEKWKLILARFTKKWPNGLNCVTKAIMKLKKIRPIKFEPNWSKELKDIHNESELNLN